MSSRDDLRPRMTRDVSPAPLRRRATGTNNVCEECDQVSSSNSVNSYDTESETANTVDKKHPLDAEWKSGAEAVATVKQFAAAEGFALHVRSSGGSSRALSCTCVGCPVQIHLRKRQTDSTWHVTSNNLEHVNCTSCPKLSAALIANVAGFRDAITVQRDIGVKALVNLAQDLTGTYATSKVVRSAKQRVLDSMDENWEHGFQLIEPFLNGVKALNAGTIATVERNEQNQFQRLFVMLGQRVKAANAAIIHNMFGIDAAHMKHRKYNGQLLLFVGRDGANRNLVLACALVPSENKENYLWFLENIKQAAGINTRLNREENVIISDRDKGIAGALGEALEKVHQTKCFKHIMRNCRAAMAKKRAPQLGFHESVAWAACSAETEAEFEEKMTTIGAISPEAASFLRSTDPTCWALAFNSKNGHVLNNVFTSNFVESENSKWKPRRFMAPLACTLDYLRAESTMQFERVGEAQAQEHAGKFIHANIMKLYDEQRRLARTGYTVRQNSEHTATVVSTQRGDVAPRERFVDLNTRSCSCLFWQQRGIPCRHAIVFAQRKQGYDWSADSASWYESAFWPVYRTSNVGNTYNFEPIHLPPMENLVLDGRTLPPPVVTQRGAPRKRRFRSAGGGQGGRAGKAKKARHCAICGSEAHNKRTCTQL